MKESDWISRKIVISKDGIENHLKFITPIGAILEYIWNGFDAEANEVDILIKYNSEGKFNKLEISDNGEGIPFEELDKKFDSFYASEKSKVSKTLPKGKKGMGRLTFSKFCYRVMWNTIYKKGNEKYEYSIAMDSVKSLNDYNVQSKPAKVNKKLGTKVIFEGFKEDFSQKEGVAQKIIDAIKEEFCLLLELFKERKFVIKINGEVLDYSNLILDSESNNGKTIEGHEFNIRYVQWKNLLKNQEGSKFYFLNNSNFELHKDNSPLNKEDDVYHHSLFISGIYFNNFNFTISEESEQTSLEGKTKKDKVFKKLGEYVLSYLRKKRKPFLFDEAETLAESYDSKGLIFVKTQDVDLREIRKNDVKETIKEFYRIEPKIFTKLNLEHTKTFFR